MALKVVSARAPTPGVLKRFKREAQAAAKLRSPNIVQVLDYGEFEGQPYLAMELLRGEDLARRIAREGKLSLERCARIVEGVAKGVQLAHDGGILHRDLKPANIFLEQVGDDEIVKVLDFGIAKELSAPIDPGSTTGVGIVGSPAYMSPEQVWAKNVGIQTDVWALGVIAFEMISGKNPFLDETLARIFERIVRDPLPQIGDTDPGLSAELDGFFERALARSPADRIASARDFAEQFRVAIAGTTGRAARALAVAATEPALGRSQAAVTLRRSEKSGAGGLRRGRTVALALILVAAVGLFVLWRRRDSGETPRDEAQRAAGERPAAIPALVAMRAEPPPSASSSGRPEPATIRVEQAPAPAASPRPSAAIQRAAPVPRVRKSASPTPPTAASLDPRFGIPIQP